MKTNLDSHFKTSSELEKNGVWFEINEKSAFLIKPLNRSNPNVKAAFAKEYKPYARQIEMGSLDDKIQRQIEVRIFIKACLVDWRGIEIEGKDTAYDTEAAEILFMELPELFAVLWAHCQDFRNYREDVGNS